MFVSAYRERPWPNHGQTEDPALPRPTVTEWRFPECQRAAHSDLASLRSLYLLVGGGKEDRDREGVEEGKNTGLGLGQAHTERCSKHLGFCSEIQPLTHS